jgi:hypothetical protein
MVWSFVYVALCRLLQLVALLCRSERSKELEILLLRHELAILRRRPRRAPIRPVDRVILERSRGRYRGAPGQAVGESGDGSALASPAGQAAVDVFAQKPGAAAARSSATGARCSTRTREPGLGLPADRRRAARPRHLDFGHIGADDPHPPWAAAVAAA